MVRFLPEHLAHEISSLLGDILNKIWINALTFLEYDLSLHILENLSSAASWERELSKQDNVHDHPERPNVAGNTQLIINNLRCNIIRRTAAQRLYRHLSCIFRQSEIYKLYIRNVIHILKHNVL